MPLEEDKLKQYAIFNNIPFRDADDMLQSPTIEKPNPIVRNTRLAKKEPKEEINFIEADKINQEVVTPDPSIQKQPDNFVDIRSGNTAVEKSIRDLKVTKDDKDFLYKLAKRESSLNPNAQTPSGTYKGLYQFSKKSLSDIGMNMGRYKSDINAQHEAALKYGYLNLKRLSRFTNLIGSKINGTKVTKEGMMAASHLGGTKNVIKYLQSNGKADFKDGNGTPVSEYMKLMEH